MSRSVTVNSYAYTSAVDARTCMALSRVVADLDPQWSMELRRAARLVAYNIGRYLVQTGMPSYLLCGDVDLLEHFRDGQRDWRETQLRRAA